MLPILLVDDDPGVLQSLGYELKQAGYRTRAAASPVEALALVEKDRFALVIQDLNFSRRTTGEEGLLLLDRLRRAAPALPVVLLTAWGSIPLAVEGMRRGAFDFLTKPWSQEGLLQTVRTALALADAPAADAPTDRAALDARHDFSMLVGHDPALVRVLHVIARVAPTEAPVLVLGESGTGKELVAEALHRNSPRRTRPLVKVNLGGLSTSLFESEMFGHVRGAFTDAVADRQGRFALADGGTLFLDEVGDLDLGSQVKLLRVLQDRTFEPVGTSQPRTADVRIVSATNRALPDLVAAGRFREDLLYRLNLITVSLPPLRERPADLPLLVRHFLEALARTYRRPGLGVTERALAFLHLQPWPGNVRELRHTVERTVLLADHDLLDAPDFAAALAIPALAVSASRPDGDTATLEEAERRTIAQALRAHSGNLSRVADALGLSRQALYRRLEKYGLRP